MDQQLVVDVRGSDEWIVTSSDGARPLHVYRVGPADWLVSEVGRGTEGRGPDIRRALSALYDGRRRPEWADSLVDALDALDAEGGRSGDPTSSPR